MADVRPTCLNLIPEAAPNRLVTERQLILEAPYVANNWRFLHC